MGKDRMSTYKVPGSRMPCNNWIPAFGVSSVERFRRNDDSGMIRLNLFLLILAICLLIL